MIARVPRTVVMLFTEVSEDFERPTIISLMKVADALARKADSWGAPEGVIACQKLQIQKILNLLK